MINFRNKRSVVVIMLLLILVLGTLPIQGNIAHASGAEKGVALKASTNVYDTTSTNSKVLKSYAAGSILKYKSYSADWYSATVFINGKGHNGYIHKSDVETAVVNQVRTKGIGTQSPTAVYASASTGSKKLKTYSNGSILIYRTFTSNWYEATVYINGKATIGYIHKSHVENSISAQEILTGIGLNDPTAIFAQASTSSKKLKTYAGGSILKYKTFSSNWYEATVYINGKPTTGYIHKSHVESTLNKQENLQGIGLASPTTFYSRASTGAPKLKSYSQGSILKYKTFSDNWYEATVYVNGIARTGYIPRANVDGIVEKQDNLRGIGLQNSTTVYANASTGSKKLKSYSQGTILSYKTFTTNWYEAVVYINGKRTTGYIHSSHVEGVFDKSESLDGISLKSPTNVYSRASKNANVLRSYPEKNYLVFKTLSSNWYEATVILNGTRTTGYIHKDDVDTDKVFIKTTSYSGNFNSVVDTQMTRNPQVSGQTGGWADASRQQVEYYVNSSNFNQNSTDYYQFLVLSQPADLNANEVNQKILFNHGILTNEAQAFIDAGNKFNVNEAYLISHALLETGNGSSTLAKGVPVDRNGNVVAANKAVHTVYNMYGVGAVDSDPLKGGAKRAFDEGWFTPAEAIIGGAEFINTYITRGQDTLYKIRWNPTSPGYPQYATDIAWATKQTTNISRIYSLLDRYVLIYDVPRYANQPSSSGNPNSYLTKAKSTMSMFNAIIENPSDNGESNEIIETPEVDKPVELEEVHEPEEIVESADIAKPEETPETEESSEVDEENESEESSEEEDINELEEIEIYGVSSDDLELKDTPNELDSTVSVTIPEGTKLEITAIDGTWYETNYEGEIGWIEGEYVTLLNLLEVIVDTVNLHEEPNNSKDPITTVNLGAFLAAVLSEDDTIIQENDWIQVLYNGEKAWINGGENGTEYIDIK